MLFRRAISTTRIPYMLIRNYSHNNNNNDAIKSNPIFGGNGKKKERKIKDYMIWGLGKKTKW